MQVSFIQISMQYSVCIYASKNGPYFIWINTIFLWYYDMHFLKNML